MRRAFAGISLRLWALVAACFVVCVVAGAMLAFVVRPAPSGSAAALPSSSPVYANLLQRQSAPDFTLTDQNGNPVTLSAQKGKLVLLAFMDPLCVQLCPVLGRDIAAIEQQLPPSVHPELLVVSVAAGRTAADVNHFVTTNLTSAKWQGGWHWLIGPSAAALKLTWLAWDIPITPPQDDLLAVIDPEGYLRVEYPAPVPIDDAVSSIVKVDT
jgi:cytochrome oxidase Cu insertion factor (SCO1/SenC/PrrC family)